MRKSNSRVHLSPTWVVVVLSVMLVAAISLAVTLTSSGPSAVTSRLLSISDLPGGWSALSAKASTTNELKNKCLSGLNAKSQANATSAMAAFSERSGVPSLVEHLAMSSSVDSAYAHEIRALNACHSLLFKEDRQIVHATISPLAMATAGSRSAAYALSFTLKGLSITTDIVVFHTKSSLGEVLYSDTTPPPMATVLSYAREAARKSEGRTVSAQIDSIVSAPARIAHTSVGAVGYRELGSGPPLVLIMGYGGTMEVWDPQFVDALAEDYHVVVFDNSGIGHTHALAAPLTIDAMANQTSALIDALGLKEPDVLGWSMGGMIAQGLAVEHPTQVGRLVLCATYPGTGTDKPAQTAINDLKSGDSTKVMSVLFPSNQVTAQESFEIATGNYPPSSSPSAAVVSAQTNAVDEWFDGRDTAGRKTANITVPTLVADGTVDRLDPIENDHRLASLIPGAQLVLYPDAGHAFLFQDEVSFVPVVEAFLRGS